MSRQSEKGIIGCLLLDENCIAEVSTVLSEGMFTDDFYREIYIHYLKTYEAGEKANEASLKWVLEDKYPDDYINNELAECVDSVTTTVELKTFAKAVVSDFKAREVDKVIQHTPINGKTVYEDVKGVIRQLQEIVEDRESHEKRLSDLTGFKDQYFCDKSTNGVKFGIHGLDDMTGYLEGGDVIVIGARPSVGKSAFVIQVTNNMAKEGKKIAFYNLEMTEKQIYERYVSHISGIELTRLRRAIAYTDNEQELFDRANEIIAKNYSNLTVITGSKSISEIRAECINKDYDIIIIDYLQLIIPDSSYRGNRFAEVGKISRDLKNLATELKIPVVALSQLNRVSESTETKEPTMGELRESGNVEQDASIIILMWNLNEERTLKGIKVDKNRQGKTGKIELKFDGSRMKFIEEEWEDSTDYPFT